MNTQPRQNLSGQSIFQSPIKSRFGIQWNVTPLSGHFGGRIGICSFLIEPLLWVISSLFVNNLLFSFPFKWFHARFACMFDDYLWKSFVYRTTFSNVKYQDLCATINPSKIKLGKEKRVNY